MGGFICLNRDGARHDHKLQTEISRRFVITVISIRKSYLIISLDHLLQLQYLPLRGAALPVPV